MIYSFIPDFAHLEQSITIAQTYEAGWEYNDFVFPQMYDDAEGIQRRIEVYKELNRDRTKDTMHGAFLGLDLAAIDPVIRARSRELYRQSMSIANHLGIKGVVFHTGLIGSLKLDYYLNNWLEETVAFWTDICAIYPELMVYMENSFEQDPDIFIRLMDRMKNVPNFKLCLDYGHAILTTTPIEEWVKRLSPFIGHMHLNDNDLIDDLHLVPGQGKIDFIKWKRLMEENNIDTSVLLEINGCDRATQALEYMRTL